MVKNLDPGRGCQYSAYWSDHPLIGIRIPWPEALLWQRAGTAVAVPPFRVCFVCVHACVCMEFE